MYHLIKSIVETGKYDLSRMLAKLEKSFSDGKITDEQYTELCELAQSNAKVEKSIDLIAKNVELEQRMTVVEAKVSTETTEEYPEFVVGKWYYTGNKITFEGAKYVCIAPEGAVCVWSPKDYPAYWQAE